jgi:hypothetical protein
MAAFLQPLSGGMKLPPPTGRKRSFIGSDATIATFSKETWI